MNKDALLTLAKICGDRSSAAMSDAVFSSIAESSTQYIYSEGDIELTNEYGFNVFTELFSDIIQNDYCESELNDRLNEFVEETTDEYANKIADICQVSYSTDQYNDIRSGVVDLVTRITTSELNNLFNVM